MTSECECSECGTTGSANVWGFVLLAREGWDVMPDSARPVSRCWLCGECAERAERLARGSHRTSCIYRIRKTHVSMRLHAPSAPLDDADLPVRAYR
jgi:hypothetical protein